MDKLTPTQTKVFGYIESKIASSGVAPTLREICGHMGYSAVGSAQDVVAALRRKGFLMETEKQAARSIVVVPTKKHKKTSALRLIDSDPNTYEIPLLGSVPAGNPVEALENQIGTMRLSMALLPSPRPSREELFALRATGQSMVGAGILDGDWLVVRSQNEASEQAIVVARLDQDVTVKRLCKDARRGWYLKPENELYQAKYADENSFAIVGQVLALQRSLS